MRKGNETRTRILEIAEAAVLAKGFGATSIDEIIAEAGITKSGFFYHFRDKNELARAMLVRYVEKDDRIFDDVLSRGRELSDDPLQACLISLKLLAEIMANLPNAHPGCLIATFTYQERLFDREVREIMTESVRAWNDRFRRIFAEIARVYPPRDGIETEDLADMFSCVVDGAIINSKALNEPHWLERQILAFRSLVKMVFSPAVAVKMARAA